MNTEGAFHTFHMTEAAKLFRPILDATELQRPSAKVLSNYTGTYHPDDPTAIKPNLFYQLFHPVRWIWGSSLRSRKATTACSNLRRFRNRCGAAGEAAEPGEHHAAHHQGVGHNALYIPAINSETIRGAAQFIQSWAGVRDRANNSEDNSVDKSWFHLLLPIRDEMLTGAGEDLDCAWWGNMGSATWFKLSAPDSSGEPG